MEERSAHESLYLTLITCKNKLKEKVAWMFTEQWLINLLSKDNFHSIMKWKICVNLQLLKLHSILISHLIKCTKELNKINCHVRWDTSNHIFVVKTFLWSGISNYHWSHLLKPYVLLRLSSLGSGPHTFSGTERQAIIAICIIKWLKHSFT